MEPGGGASSSPHFVRNRLRGAGPRASPHFVSSGGSPDTGRKRRRSSADAASDDADAGAATATATADAGTAADAPGKACSTASGSHERPTRHLRRRRRPRAIIIGQAPPPNLEAADERDFLALDKPAVERRLARLAGCSVEELWRAFERKNVLAFWPGKKERAAKHHKAAGYTKHESAGDLFPLDDARLEALRIDLDSYALVVLLGLNVARSFNVAVRLPPRDGSCAPAASVLTPVPHTMLTLTRNGSTNTRPLSRSCSTGKSSSGAQRAGTPRSCWCSHIRAE